MSDYNTILLAVDFSGEAEQITSKAMALAKSNNAALHITHVVEPPINAYVGDLPIIDIDGIEEKGRAHMKKFAEKHGFTQSQQHITVGRPVHQIHTTAKELKADLIVMGSHGRHGLALLLGSTATGVLHGATCDVLAVRINSS